jgi:hypothetical protein
MRYVTVLWGGVYKVQLLFWMSLTCTATTPHLPQSHFSIHIPNLTIIMSADKVPAEKLPLAVRKNGMLKLGNPIPQ